VFTRSETLRGARTSAVSRSLKTRFRYAKKLANLGLTKEWIDLAKAVLASPVMSGTAAFFLVSAVQALTTQLSTATAAAPSSSSTSQANTALTQAQTNPTVKVVESYFNQFLNLLPGGLGSLFSSGLQLGGISPSSLGITGSAAGTVQSTASGFLSLLGAGGSLDYFALKIAIIVYIASGGNLAGLLSSAGTSFSGVLGGLTGGLTSMLGGTAGTAAAGAAEALPIFGF
jgi:hypothetical protein